MSPRRAVVRFGWFWALLLTLALAAPAGAEEIRETFRDNQSALFGETQDDSGTTKISQETLVMTVGQPRLMIFQTPAQISPPPRAFFVEVSCRPVAGPANNSYGLIIGREGGDLWQVGLSSDGYYLVRKYQAGRWSLLRRWSKSSRLGPDRHLLRVEVHPPTARILVDGQPLTEVSDPVIGPGQTGVYVQALEEAGVSVAFDDFVLAPLD